MGYRFRKSKDFGFGRINLSKSGIGFSTGIKGFRMTKKTNGGNRTTFSLPGTGLSYVKDSSKKSKKKSSKHVYSEDLYEMDDLNEDEEIDYSEPITQSSYSSTTNQPINNAAPKKKAKAGTILLWILGWLFIFPVPVTILLVRNKKIKQGIKIPVIVVVWLVYLIFAWALNLSSNEPTVEETAITESVEEKVVETLSADAETTAVAAVEEKEAGISMPISSEICKGMDYEKLSDLFREAGFKNIITTTQEFDDSSEYEDGAVVKVIVDGKESFSMKDSFEEDKKINIVYATIKVPEVVREKEKTVENPETKGVVDYSVTEEGNAPQKGNEEELKSTIQELAATMFVATTVNVRGTPSYDGEKVGSLSLNDEVKVTGKTDDGWYRIQYGDGEAYVKEGFFSDSRIEEAVAPAIANGGAEAENNSETSNTGSSSSSHGGSSNFNTYDNLDQQQTEDTYVLNTRKGGKKFHLPSCDSVPRISPDNYATSSKTREELIEEGYKPCQKCNP